MMLGCFLYQKMQKKKRKEKLGQKRNKNQHMEQRIRSCRLSFMHSHVYNVAIGQGLNAPVVKVHTNLSASELLANGAVWPHRSDLFRTSLLPGLCKHWSGAMSTQSYHALIPAGYTIAHWWTWGETRTCSVRKDRKSIVIVKPAVLGALTPLWSGMGGYAFPLPCLTEQLTNSKSSNPSSLSPGPRWWHNTGGGPYANELSNPATQTPSTTLLPLICKSTHYGMIAKPDLSRWAGEQCLMQTKWRILWTERDDLPNPQQLPSHNLFKKMLVSNREHSRNRKYSVGSTKIAQTSVTETFIITVFSAPQGRFKSPNFFFSKKQCTL